MRRFWLYLLAKDTEHVLFNGRNMLKVYRASAGSGKTYTLVYEYIRYLFNAQFNNAQCTTNGLEPWRKMHNAQLFDVVYFDAFSPDAQPELWTEKVFRNVYALMRKGGVLTTYCAKGDVRRAMLAAGFKVEKLQGPPGKRHILRATKL